jgi:hypothetical protein
MRRIFTGIHLLLVLFLLGVCASRSMMLVARSKTTTPLALKANVTLACQPNPRPEDEQLRALVGTALEERGLTAVSPEAAGFTLACWMDESWDEVYVPVVQSPPVGQVTTYPAQRGALGRTEVTYRYSEPYPAQDASRFLSTKGIRLALYSRGAPAADRPEAVWEGYLELDAQVSPDRISKALPQLLDCLGTNYVGRVPLPP